MANDFSKAVADFALEVQEADEKIIKGVTVALFRAVILSSPVDTGRFRANWFLGGIVASNLQTTRKDKSGTDTINKMASGVNQTEGIPEEFSLTNNLPYSEVIEFGQYPNPVKQGTKIPKKYGGKATYEKRSAGGFSKLAPKGVVRVNATRFASLLEAEAARVGYGSI